MKLSHLQIFLFFVPMILITSCFSSCGTQSHTNQKEIKTRTEAAETEASSNLESPILQIEPYAVNQLKFKTAVRSILEDSKGNYWFGSWNEGVCRYDGKSFTYFTEEDGLSNNQVRTIQEDQHGNIWFATGRGITSFDGKKMTVQVNPDDINASSFVGSVWKKEANDLWFNLDIDRGGSTVKGICRYDNQRLSFLAFPEEVLNQGLFQETGAITGISKGKNNQIWFANYEGIFGFDGFDFQLFKDNDFAYHVRSIFEDSKGNLWIGNNGIGVLLYDGKTTINFTEKHKLENPDYLKTRRVRNQPGLLARVFSMGEDIYGNIWFGTVDAGLWKYDGENLTNYTKDDGLTSMGIMEIYLDKKGALWFGMGDGSVCQFNGNTFDKIY